MSTSWTIDKIPLNPSPSALRAMFPRLNPTTLQSQISEEKFRAEMNQPYIRVAKEYLLEKQDMGLVERLSPIGEANTLMFAYLSSFIVGNTTQVCYQLGFEVHAPTFHKVIIPWLRKHAKRFECCVRVSVFGDVSSRIRPTPGAFRVRHGGRFGRGILSRKYQFIVSDTAFWWVELQLYRCVSEKQSGSLRFVGRPKIRRYYAKNTPTGRAGQIKKRQRLSQGHVTGHSDDFIRWRNRTGPTKPTHAGCREGWSNSVSPPVRLQRTTRQTG